MKIGYKGTDANMKCKGQQYEIGKEYLVTKDEQVITISTIGDGNYPDPNLKSCTKSVIHYCNKLEDCFSFYTIDTSRFFEIRVKGPYKDENSAKSCTTHMEFLREITKEEINAVKEKANMDRMDTILKLKEVRELQEKFPNLILGGSLSLYLQGARLKRLETNGVHDLDLIHPYWIDLKEIGAEWVDEKNSGNTFDESYIYKGIPLDLVINPNNRYTTVEFNGHKYKVNLIEQVLEFKIKYAQQKNGKKHRDDIRELLCIER